MFIIGKTDKGNVFVKRFSTVRIGKVRFDCHGTVLRGTQVQARLTQQINT